MSKCDKLLSGAREHPDNLRFSDLRTLAECYGFQFARQSGSHVIYKRPGRQGLLTFQNDGGKAKAYQVRQLLGAIAELESDSQESR